MRVSSWTLAVGAAVAIACLGVARPVFAQDYEAAKAAYMEATKAHNAGEFDRAVTLFVQAYDITKDPALFKKIAGSYEAGGKKEEAAIYYRRYLNDAKTAIDRDEIKAKIEALEGGPSDGTTPPETDLGAGGDGGDGGTPGGDTLAPDFGDGGDELPPGGDTGAPPAFTDKGSRWQRTAAWVSVGLAAVMLTTGSVLATSALSREDDINRLLFPDPETGLPREYSGTVKQDYEDNKEEGEMLSRYAMISFIGAGVFTGTAVLFFILDSSAKSETPAAAAGLRVTPYATHEGGGFVAGWSF